MTEKKRTPVRMAPNKSAIIHGRTINFEEMAHCYYMEEIHKEKKHFVYIVFSHGGRIYWRHDTKEQAEELLQIINDFVKPTVLI